MNLNFTKHAVIVALFAYSVFASEIVYKTPAEDTPTSETKEDRVMPLQTQKVSIHNSPDVAYYNVFKYLGSKDIDSLLLSDKKFNKTIKEWIKIFLYSFSPKLVISDSKFNQLIHSLIISFFPGIESIKDSEAKIQHKKYIALRKYPKFSSEEMKTTILAILQNLFDDSNDKIMSATFIDKNGSALLLWAAEKGHTEIAKILIENGADANDINRSLIRAAVNGQPEIVELLIKKNADVNEI